MLKRLVISGVIKLIILVQHARNVDLLLGIAQKNLWDKVLARKDQIWREQSQMSCLCNNAASILSALY